MQGSAKVIAQLNELLAGELTAMDLYLLQGRMFGDWGYTKLQERIVHESEDERQHADALIQRILFLGGEPNMTARVEATPGKSPKEMLELDLKYEIKVANNLNAAIEVCVNEGDHASRAVLDKLLVETEEDHIDWLESQLYQIESIGLELYLAKQM